MKTLLLLRHGKSDWDSDTGRDHERPLAKRGKKAARQIGKLLANAQELPQCILCSTATRAVSTAELVLEDSTWQGKLEQTRELYEATPEQVLGVVHHTSDKFESLMLVGHEPTTSALIAALCGANARVPTACVARIDIGAQRWRDVRAGGGELMWLLTPRLLGP